MTFCKARLTRISQLFTAMLLVAIPSIAQNIDGIKGPVCVLQDSVTRAVFTLSPEKSTYNVVVTDGLARIELTQLYINKFGRIRDIFYVFPLPHNGSVNSMSMITKGKLYKATIVEKQQAQRQFDSVVKNGGTGALMLQDRPNIFQQHLANIAYGDSAWVKIGVSVPLKYLNGIYELAIPTMIGERYQSAGQNFVPSGPFWNPPENRNGQTLQINVLLMTGFLVKRIESPTHPMITNDLPAMKQILTDRGVLDTSLKMSEPNASGIILLSQATYPNRDFVLRFSRAESKQDFAMASCYDPLRKEGYFAMNIFPDSIIFSGQRPNLDIILLVDRSGSQQGWPLEAEKKVALDILSRLQSTDKVNVLAFSDDLTWAFGGAVSVDATPGNIATANALVTSLTATNGTQLLRGIQAALSTPQNSGYERYYIFLTDGFITNETEILAAIKNHPSHPTIFTFGCGNSINRYLIDGAAATGNGGYGTVITELDAREGVGAFVDAAWRMIETPQLKNVTVDFGTSGANGIMMPAGSNLYVGRPIEIYGRYLTGGTHLVTVKGMMGNKEVVLQKNIPFAATRTMNVMLSKIWARQYIEYLSMQEGMTQNNKTAIIEVSTAYQVLSKYTAFLAISPQNLTGQNGTPSTEIREFPLINSIKSQAAKLTVAMDNGMLRIVLPHNTVLRKMSVYDLKGRLVYCRAVASEATVRIFTWDGRIKNGTLLHTGNYILVFETTQGTLRSRVAWR